jgi:hypothetical protein
MMKHINSANFEAQSHQIQSSLTEHHTYSRFFSAWTDNLMHRTYTIFMIKDKSNENESKDFMIESKVLTEIFHFMIFNKGVLEKSRLGGQFLFHRPHLPPSN